MSSKSLQANWESIVGDSLTHMTIEQLTHDPIDLWPT